jgi:uncharacterized protein
MKTRSIKILVSSSIGEVSAEYLEPNAMRCMLTLAHGAGAGMNHPFMVSIAQELALLNIGTLRFNFPFTEQKKKRPDVPAVAHKTIEAAIQKASALYAETPLFVSGKSFGGRMSSQYLAKHHPERIKGIVFLGFPLHPPGKPTIDRADHLKMVNVPMLFLQGTRDALATWALMHEVTEALPLATLIKVEGADHGFKVGKQNIIPALAASIQKWVEPMFS